MKKISIHALLTESDIFPPKPLWEGINFNPRSPHGERLNAPTPRNTRILFQSTLSSRRATWPDDVGGGMIGISIHALLTESDKAGRVGRPHVGPFQSTLSSRRATANTTKLALSFLSKVPI